MNIKVTAYDMTHLHDNNTIQQTLEGFRTVNENHKMSSFKSSFFCLASVWIQFAGPTLMLFLTFKTILK